MNNGPLQIFDLLLGNISGAETQSPSKSVDGNIPDMLFGNILSGLLDTSIVVGNGEEASTKQALPFVNTDSNELTNQGLLSENDTKPVHRFTHLLSELKQETNTNQVDENILNTYQVEPTNEIVQTDLVGNLQSTDEESENVTVFNKQLRELLPGIETTIAEPRIKQLLNEKPVALPEGEFEIVDAKVSGNNVELTISSSALKSEQIQVILPKEELAKIVAQNKTNSDTPRVALENFNESEDSVEQLLSRLNLKKIEVRNINENLKTIENQNDVKIDTGSKTKTEKVNEISLIFEETESGDMIKKRLNPHQVKAVTRSENNSIISNNKSEFGLDEQLNTTRSPLLDMGGTSKIKSAMISGGNRFDLNNLPLVSDNGNSVVMNETVNSNFGLTEDFNLELDLKATNNGKSSSVRFTLPDDIRTALKPGGKAVTFTIEPENIGQAKLSLSLHDNGLRARVVVENTQAKMLMDNSIDLLTDQLSKADIKVASIEVSVGGQDSKNQFLDRRPQWSRKNGNQNNSTPEVSDTDRATPTAYTSSSDRTYVSQSGVNLLA